MQSAISEIKYAFGQIDIVVNAAGITELRVKLSKIPVTTLQRCFKSIFWILQYCQGSPSRNEGKKLWKHPLIASIAGKECLRHGLVFRDKGGCNWAHKGDWENYAESGITINSLAPAVIKTAIHDEIPQEQIDYMTDKIPMKRCGELDEIVSQSDL